MATSVIDLLKKNEGFSGTIYNDTGGVPTIGYGFTAMVLDGKDGRPKFSDYKNKEMTEEEANDLLVNKIVPYFERQLRNKLDDYDGLADNQRAAIVDLAYRNGVAGLGKSGVYNAINKGDFEEATNIIRDSKDLQKENSVVLQPGDKAYEGITGRNTEAADVFSGVQTASPRTKSSSQTIAPEKNKQQKAVDAVNKIKKAQQFKTLRAELSPAFQSQIEKEIIDFSTEFASTMKKGWVGSRDEIPAKNKEFDEKLNEYVRNKYKELGLDESKPEDWAKMKAIFKYASSIPQGEEFGIKIGNKDNRLIDTNFEILMEDRSGSGNWYSMFGEGAQLDDTIPSSVQEELQSDEYVSNVLADKERYGLDFKINKGQNILDIDEEELSKRVGVDISGKYFGEEKDKSQQLIQDVFTGVETPPSTEDAKIKDSLAEGIAAGEALELEDEEIEEEESMKSLGLNEDGSQKPPVGPDNQEKMRKAEKVLSGLKAAAGILSLSKALRDPEIETPELSPLITEAVEKQRQLSKSGLTAAEKSAAMSNLDNAYAGAMKNVLRASGGQRGMFLAGQGVVDANRIQGLNQLAAQDAAVRQQNVQQYNALASSVGQMQLQRDMSVEQMKQATMQKNRDVLGGIGTNLVSDAISDVSWYLNPNRDLIEQAQRTNLEGLAGSDRVPYDASKSASVGLASTNPNIKSTEQEKQLQKQKNKTFK